jgi:hypothetical protein
MPFHMVLHVVQVFSRPCRQGGHAPDQRTFPLQVGRHTLVGGSHVAQRLLRLGKFPFPVPSTNASTNVFGRLQEKVTLARQRGRHVGWNVVDRVA